MKKNTIDKFNPQTALTKAQQLQKTNETNEAERLYKKIIATSKNPKTWNTAVEDVVANVVTTDSTENNLNLLENLLKNKLITNKNKAFIYEVLGVHFTKLKQYKKSIQYYNAGLEQTPQDSALYGHRGASYLNMGDLRMATSDLMQATLIDSNNFHAHKNLGHCLTRLKLYGKAFECYKRSLMAEPNQPYLMSFLINAKHHACDWSNHEADNEYLKNMILNGETTEHPFILLNITDSPKDQLIAANATVKNSYQVTPITLHTNTTPHATIRIGYLSADFHTHATTHLIKELFSSHNREKFRVIGLSLDTKNSDETTVILKKAFDEYFEFPNQTAEEIAEFIRNLDIDILVDLKGYTHGALPKILAYRPAPIQVNYLGFPGTMGGDFMDYIIADHWLVPDQSLDFYSEKVVRLPVSYQINNQNRDVPKDSKSRSEHHLPEDGFVFCCFNNNYKITPSIFSIWMSVLNHIPNSVLWLLEDNVDATRNLKFAAKQAGVDPNRLIFAPRTKNEAHLARHEHADLFLDTTPINAHTTASDALWMGLPVLTLTGQSFAARVATSLLHAVNLPELAQPDADSYAAKAIALATQPKLLDSLKQRLAAERYTCDLFNTRKTTAALETAFETMYMRRHAKSAPQHFDVPPLAVPKQTTNF